MASVSSSHLLLIHRWQPSCEGPHGGLSITCFVRTIQELWWGGGLCWPGSSKSLGASALVLARWLLIDSGDKPRSGPSEDSSWLPTRYSLAMDASNEGLLILAAGSQLLKQALPSAYLQKQVRFSQTWRLLLPLPLPGIIISLPLLWNMLFLSCLIKRLSWMLWHSRREAAFSKRLAETKLASERNSTPENQTKHWRGKNSTSLCCLVCRSLAWWGIQSSQMKSSKCCFALLVQFLIIRLKLQFWIKIPISHKPLIKCNSGYKLAKIRIWLQGWGRCKRG